MRFVVPTYEGMPANIPAQPAPAGRTNLLSEEIRKTVQVSPTRCTYCPVPSHTLSPLANEAKKEYTTGAVQIHFCCVGAHFTYAGKWGLPPPLAAALFSFTLL
jgi:hypothetical protein